MKRLFACFGGLTIGLLLFPTTTQAQYRSFVTGDAGMYWWVDGGATIPQDGHITEFGPFGSGQNITYDVGAGLDAAFGYAFNKYFATEVQLGGDLELLRSGRRSLSPRHVLRDNAHPGQPRRAVPIPRTRVVPYIGGGVGGAATFFDTDSFYVQAPGGSVTLHGSDSDFVFAWQGLAGVRLELNPKMSIGLAYRFLYVDPSTFSFDSYHHGGPPLDLGLSAFESHLVALTFKVQF